MLKIGNLKHASGQTVEDEKDYRLVPRRRAGRRKIDRRAAQAAKAASV